MLANLLRSQRHSISVLRSLEKEQKTKQQGKVPNDPTNASSGITAANADLLSEAVPSPPPAKIACAKSNQRSDTPTGWRSFPVVLSSEFEQSLGELYPFGSSKSCRMSISFSEHGHMLQSQIRSVGSSPTKNSIKQRTSSKRRLGTSMRVKNRTRNRTNCSRTDCQNSKTGLKKGERLARYRRCSTCQNRRRDIRAT